MNEKIKELVIRSNLNKILEEHSSEYGNGTMGETPYDEVEKFARLIIQECIDECNKEYDASLSATAIRQKFDIKE